MMYLLGKHGCIIKNPGCQNMIIIKSDKPVVCVATPMNTVVKWDEQIYDANYNHLLWCSNEVLDTYTMSGRTKYDNVICYQFTPKENSKLIDSLVSIFCSMVS